MDGGSVRGNIFETCQSESFECKWCQDADFRSGSNLGPIVQGPEFGVHLLNLATNLLEFL